MSAIEFEGRKVAIESGDTFGSALYRAGVRVFTRSFKYHRPRGLYCLSGDCPNCFVNVDGDPCVRACTAPAVPGQTVRREGGWPSVERDALAVFDRVHGLLPVGFYYKTMVRPRWLWPRVEPWVRRIAGLGAVPEPRRRENREAQHVHRDVLVVGAGVAGLAAALAAAHSGRTVLLCDEDRIGARLAPGPTAAKVAELRRAAQATEQITILEGAPAIGIYEGPLVVLDGPSLLHLVHPATIVVATGALEAHGVFGGNDLPGVWLARGAARLAGVHGVAPGQRAVLVARTAEAAEHAQTLRQAGTEVTEIRDGEIVKTLGRDKVTGVVIEQGSVRKTYPCDALVLALGLVARDELARQSEGASTIVAGDAAQPGCTVAEAEASGRRAALGEGDHSPVNPLPPPAHEGIVCLCEDVCVDELDRAWKEGFRSAEIIKRYTTTTMGPCRGLLCQRHLRAFVDRRPEPTGPGSGATTARPPVRGITLERVAAGHGLPVELRTALHARHVGMGATMEPVGEWRRPERYGEVLDEYWAVRRQVSIMDVGTLGKFLVGGPDATELLDRFYPCRLRDLEPGRLRYTVVLGEHGYVVDDGLICALEDGHWYTTFTSGGGATAEATLRDWAETWELEVHFVNLTAARGAINVAGPRSRELLQRLSDDAFDNGSFPYLHHRAVEVAGIRSRAIRLGFVGELSYELHHSACDSVALWDALLEAGQDLDIRPHGMEALRLLRLEKGHVIVGQDTDFDATPEKLKLGWAVELDKPAFVGRSALERIGGIEAERGLVALRFDRGAPLEGSPLLVDGKYVGYLTSSRYSPVLECGVALGWTTDLNGQALRRFRADGMEGVAVEHAFYDPEGERVRG